MINKSYLNRKKRDTVLPLSQNPPLVLDLLSPNQNQEIVQIHQIRKNKEGLLSISIKVIV